MHRIKANSKMLEFFENVYKLTQQLVLLEKA